MGQPLQNQPSIYEQHRNVQVHRMKTFLKKFRKNKAAVIGGILLFFFILVSLIGPYFVPYPEDSGNLVNKLAPLPPTTGLEPITMVEIFSVGLSKECLLH